MIKKIFVLTIFIFLTSCGYEATFSQKNLELHNFNVGKIDFKGSRNVNIRLNQKLLTIQKENVKKAVSQTKFILNIVSESSTTVITKDAKGNPATYENTVTVVLNVSGGPGINNAVYTGSTKYDHLEDRIELRKYEREIEFNLAENIANDILFDLSSLNEGIRKSSENSDINDN